MKYRKIDRILVIKNVGAQNLKIRDTPRISVLILSDGIGVSVSLKKKTKYVADSFDCR